LTCTHDSHLVIPQFEVECISLGVLQSKVSRASQAKPPLPVAEGTPAEKAALSSAYMGIARGRLQEERKSWRKDHPHVRARSTSRIPLHALTRHSSHSAVRRAGLCGQASDAARRHAGHPQLGCCHSWQGRHHLGECAHPDDYDVQRGLPKQAAHLQVQARGVNRQTALPPERIPVGQDLPLAARS
jgi:hypothetical protein